MAPAPPDPASNPRDPRRATPGGRSSRTRARGSTPRLRSPTRKPAVASQTRRAGPQQVTDRWPPNRPCLVSTSHPLFLFRRFLRPIVPPRSAVTPEAVEACKWVWLAGLVVRYSYEIPRAGRLWLGGLWTFYIQRRDRQCVLACCRQDLKPVSSELQIHRFDLLHPARHDSLAANPVTAMPAAFATCHLTRRHIHSVLHQGPGALGD